MTSVTCRAPTLIAGTPNDDAEAPHVKGQGKFAYLVWREPPTTTPPGAPRRLHDVFFSTLTRPRTDEVCPFIGAVSTKFRASRPPGG